MADRNNERVRRVQLCAAFLESSTECNHWFINVQYRGGSTRFDMRIDPSQNGDTIYETKQTVRDITGSTIKHHHFEVASNFRVKDVDRLIKQMKLHRFEFGPEGSGCQHWSYLVINHLENKGWLQSGSSNSALDRVQNCWYYTTAPNGTTIVTSKRIQVVEGIPYESDDDDDDDDDEGDDDDEDDGGEASAAQYLVPVGAYLASDGLVYPRPGYYRATDGNYYPKPS